jgi:hypothetical protein
MEWQHDFAPASSRENYMTEAWVHIGAPVLVTSGQLQGFEGCVERIDPGEDTVIVQVDLFGRTLPLSFPLSSVAEHVVPFGDQPAVLCCPQPENRTRDLLAQCPDADATFRTDCWRSTTHAFFQISRTGANHRLTVRSHDLTWPCREEMVWAVRETRLTESEWVGFTRLIDECRFWHLPYDDGVRIPRKGNRWHWRLEGYEAGRYHGVLRTAGESKSEIAACCDYVRAFFNPVC